MKGKKHSKRLAAFMLALVLIATTVINPGSITSVFAETAEEAKTASEKKTEAEKKEQQILRREYVDAFKRNLRGQLNNISIKEKDGSITNLGEKYGQKKGN